MGGNKESWMSVSAEVYGVLNPYQHIEPEIYPKTEDEWRDLYMLLKEVFLFMYLNEEDMQRII